MIEFVFHGLLQAPIVISATHRTLLDPLIKKMRFVYQLTCVNLSFVCNMGLAPSVQMKSGAYFFIVNLLSVDLQC